MAVEKKYRTYKKGQVIYIDFGEKPCGIQSGIRPAVVVSNDVCNNEHAPQITVCPMSSKLKYSPVHVTVNSHDVNGLHLSKVSNVIVENMQTVAKSDVVGSIGYITEASRVMKMIDKAIIKQYNLAETLENMARELVHNKPD